MGCGWTEPEGLGSIPNLSLLLRGLLGWTGGFVDLGI